MVKRLLIFVLLFVLVSGASVAVTSHYNDYKNKKQQETQVAQEAEAQEVSALQAQARLEAVAAFDAIKTQYEALLVECTKGQNAYESLTEFQKTQNEAPTCSPLLQE